MADAVGALVSSMSTARHIANHAELMLFRHCREGRGSENALYFRNETYSYREMADAASSCAAWLRSVGVEPGDCVILSFPDCPVLAAAYFGVVALGATAILLNPSLAAEDAFYIAQLCAARVTMVAEDAAPRWQALKSVPSMTAFKVAALAFKGSGEVAESVPLTAGTEHPAVPQANRHAYGLLSSGSTGRPKLIVHRHEDIFYGYLAFARDVLDLRAADRTVCVAKMTTGYGLGCSLLMPFLAGASSALVSEAPGAAVVTAIARHRCTLLFAQPRFLAEAVSGAQSPGAFQSLRLAITGGEPLGGALAERWRRACNAELLDSYGNTEVGFLYVTNRPGQARHGSVGKAVDGLDVEVVDERRMRVQPGQMGRLRVRGPMVIDGYWHDPVRTAQSFADGWFTTSDMFTVDQDGYLYIHGRSDHLIKLGCGDWVNPVDLEKVLLEHRWVNECAVVGAPDETGLTVLKAVVVIDPTHERSQALAAELSTMIRDRWPAEDYKRVGVIEFTSVLPKTAAGKLDRSRLSPQSMTEFSYRC